MRVGLDFRLLSLGRLIINRGMGRYTMQQLSAVLASTGDHELVLVVRPDADLNAIPAAIRRSPHVRRAVVPAALCDDEAWHDPARTLEMAADYQAWLAGLDLDVFHVTTPFVWIGPHEWAFGACPLVATHYDLIPIAYPRYYEALNTNPVVRYCYERSLVTLGRADHVIAISDYVRQEALAYLGVPPERVSVGHPFAETMFRPVPADEADGVLRRLRGTFGLRGEFVLSLPHFHHSKNIQTLLRGYAMTDPSFRRAHPLVVACDLDPSEAQQLRGWGDELGIADTLVVTGFVPDEELVALFNRAWAFVHASRYEGFGLPVLEALQCGAAVIASNATSIPEVAGPAALLADPEDPRSFADALSELAAHPDRRAALRRAAPEQARRFSGERLAAETLDAYARAIARRASAVSAAPAARRRRVAMYSPLPPLQSGISDYAVELAAALDLEGTSVEFFVDSRCAPERSIQDRYPVRHFSAFPVADRRTRYDATVYQVGASEFHQYMLEPMAERPGIVVLHDLTWGLARYHLASDGAARKRFLADFERLEGRSAIDELMRIEATAPPERWTLLEPFLTEHWLLGEIIERADAVVVHSPGLRDEIVQRHPGARAFAFPMGVRDPWQGRSQADAMTARARLEISQDAVLVGTFGRVDRVKRVEAILHALASSNVNVTLAVVGPFLEAAYRDVIVELAKDLGVADRVRILEWLPLGEFQRILLACDGVINLRHPFRKQVSATLMRAVAAGKPVAVADVAAWKFLPAECCHPVASDSDAEVAQLTAFLARIAEDGAWRGRAATAARTWYTREATPVSMARHYMEVVDSLGGPR